MTDKKKLSPEQQRGKDRYKSELGKLLESKPAMAAMLALNEFASYKTGKCRVNLDTIVAKTGIKKRNLSRGLAELQAMGWLIVRATGKASDYFCLWICDNPTEYSEVKPDKRRGKRRAKSGKSSVASNGKSELPKVASPNRQKWQVDHNFVSQPCSLTTPPLPPQGRKSEDFRKAGGWQLQDEQQADINELFELCAFGVGLTSIELQHEILSQYKRHGRARVEKNIRYANQHNGREDARQKNPVSYTRYALICIRENSASVPDNEMGTAGRSKGKQPANHMPVELKRVIEHIKERSSG